MATTTNTTNTTSNNPFTFPLYTGLSKPIFPQLSKYLPGALNPNAIKNAQTNTMPWYEQYGLNIITVVVGLIFLTIGLIMIFKVDIEKTTATATKLLA